MVFFQDWKVWLHFAVVVHQEFAKCYGELEGWQKLVVRWRHYSIHEVRLF